jgi:ribosomal protein S21
MNLICIDRNELVVNAKRRKGESFESFYRRFSRRLQQSGNMIEARKHRYEDGQPNKAAVKQSALRRIRVGIKREYLMRIGQLVEKRRGRGRRR